MLSNTRHRTFGHCPICGASDGRPCIGVPAKSAHIGRLQRAQSEAFEPRKDDSIRITGLEVKLNLELERKLRNRSQETRDDFVKQRRTRTLAATTRKDIGNAQEH